jgi:hypothetical protein
MPSMETIFAKKLATAIEEVTAAENALGSILRKIRTEPRAHKTTISLAVEDAFLRLRTARKNLVDLQKLRFS